MLPCGIESHLRFVVVGSFMGDINIGNMFLNFMLHEKVRVVAGVYLTPFFPEEAHQRGINMIWERSDVVWGLNLPPITPSKVCSWLKRASGETGWTLLTFWGGITSFSTCRGVSAIILRDLGCANEISGW
jgi:hypothetical protein